MGGFCVVLMPLVVFPVVGVVFLYGVITAFQGVAARMVHSMHVGEGCPRDRERRRGGLPG